MKTLFTTQTSLMALLLLLVITLSSSADDRTRGGGKAEYRGSGQASIDFLSRVPWAYPEGGVVVNREGVRRTKSESRIFPFTEATVVRIYKWAAGWEAEWYFNTHYDDNGFRGEENEAHFSAGSYDTREEAEKCAEEMKFLSPKVTKIWYYPKSCAPKVDKQSSKTDDNNGSEGKPNFCSGCGKKLDAGAKFCPGCGKKLE